MQVYVTDSAGAVTYLTATAGVESMIGRAWNLSVVRPPQSAVYVLAGLGNDMPKDVRITALAQATGGADAAHAIDDLRQAAEGADRLYIEHNGDAAVAHLAAFQGVGSASPMGAYAYTVELRWISDHTLRAGPLTSDNGADTLTADNGTDLILWEEEI